MEEMLALLADPPPHLLVEQLFLERLPEDLRAQLVHAQKEDHRQLARRAETLWAVRDRGTSNNALQRCPPQGQRKATTPTTSSDQLCYCHHTFGDLAHSPAVKGLDLEIIGIVVNLVSKEAEFFVEQHIQNPPETALGKVCYTRLNI